MFEFAAGQDHRQYTPFARDVIINSPCENYPGKFRGTDLSNCLKFCNTEESGDFEAGVIVLSLIMRESHAGEKKLYYLS